MRGGEIGSHGPPQAPIFLDFFSFWRIFYLFSWESHPWLLGAPLVVLRALRGATGGASEWRPPLAWCQEVLRNPYAHHGGRLQLPERGPRTKGALGKFLRFAQGHNPWASCWWNHLKASAHARAMD